MGERMGEMQPGKALRGGAIGGCQEREAQERQQPMPRPIGENNLAGSMCLEGDRRQAGQEAGEVGGAT